MMILIYFLIFLRFGGCTSDKIESKTVTAGESLRLECPRTNSRTIFWIRVVPGNLPEFIGKSPEYKRDRFTTGMGRGTTTLVIENLHVSDTGVYTCMTLGGTPAFFKGTDLTVVEAKRENLPEVHPSDPAVLSKSENATSLDGTKGSCCGSGPVQPFFSFLCKNNVEADLKVFSRRDFGDSFVKNISSSENLCCSVAKCEIGNHSEPETEVQNPECQTNNTVLYVLSAALSVGLIVTVLLLYLSNKLKNSLCGCCEANFPLQRPAVEVSADHIKQSDEEQDLVYAVPTITQRKSHNAEEEESIYTCVREN